MQSLGNLLKVLNEAKIDFVLIGGFASVVYGSSMVTRDLDICAFINPDQIERLRACLSQFHPRHRMTPKKLSFLEYPSNTKELKNIYLETDLGVLDIIGEVTGVGDFKKISANAVEIDIYGIKCKVMAIDDLIASKKALGRYKDLAVVRELEFIQKRDNELK